MVWSNEFQKKFMMPRYANLVLDHLGLDSPDHCFDRALFDSWHVPIDYRFNELGYRCRSIREHRGDEILAVGDSFTLGLGVPVQYTWPRFLEQIIGYPVLNFSINGASNDWIARKTKSLLEIFRPRAIICHFTFSHRRELPQDDWFDDERTLSEPSLGDDVDLKNFLDNLSCIKSLCKNVPCVIGWIPRWHTGPVDYHSIDLPKILPITSIDLARDGFHYGIKTNEKLAKSIDTILPAA